MSGRANNLSITASTVSFDLMFDAFGTQPQGLTYASLIALRYPVFATKPQRATQEAPHAYELFPHLAA